MYNGKITKELEKLIYEYERIFGYDPDEEISVEYGKAYRKYKADIKECISRKIDISSLNDERANYV